MTFCSVAGTADVLSSEVCSDVLAADADVLGTEGVLSLEVLSSEVVESFGARKKKKQQQKYLKLFNS